MPKLHVLAVEARLPEWAQAACADYERRMPRGYELSRTRLKRLDPKAIASRYRGWRIVALDERGRDLTTAQFSRVLDRDTAFIIGGADGLPPEFKKDAALLLRLSTLTLPHALAQVVLVEQLYRAATLLSGHPYPRG